MEKYITSEFFRSIDRAPKNERESLRRKKVIEIFEGEDGRISPKEIAGVLDTTEAQVKRFLGKTRLKNYKGPSGIIIPSKNGKLLTSAKVREIVSDRNERIKYLHNSGLSIEEVAEKEQLSLAQIKEIYISLGLPIYSLSELREIKKDADENDKITRKEQRRKRRNRKRREERARQRRIRQEEQQLSERRKEFREATGIALISNFKDLIREMKTLLQQRKSKQAIELGDRFLNDGTILTNEERENLAILLSTLKEVKEEHIRRQAEKETEGKKVLGEDVEK